MTSSPATVSPLARVAAAPPRPVRRRALRPTRERYRSLVENAPVGVFQTTPDGRYTLANPMLARIYGYAGPDEMTRALTDIARQLYVEPGRRDEFMRLLQRDDAVWGFESEVRRRDGQVIWISECARAVRAPGDGGLLGYEGTVEDVTARKRAEIEREAALRSLAQAHADLERRVRERTHALEEAHRALAAAEIEKKRFYRDVIRCVTRDRFLLADVADLEAPTVAPAAERAITGRDDYAFLRDALRRLAADAGMSDADAGDLVVAFGEAATNALKHASGARCALHRLPDRLMVTVRDGGTGIRPEDLPASLLKAGFSRAVSLGMGFTLMLEMADRVWLATDAGGTVVRLEKWLRAEDRPAAAVTDAITAWESL